MSGANLLRELGDDAALMAQAVRDGAVSARELLAASLARIEATDNQVNAFTLQTRARAEAEADAVDAQRARAPQALGPLAGVPFAVKNLYDIEGEVTLAGSVINRSHAPAEADAVLVQQMQSAGAVLV
ncbi:MAG: amidase family protein, partial [Rubrivivax sp.]